MTAIVPIVTVNASVTQSPTPLSLQQTGALITQGGTTTAPSTLTSVSTLAAGVALLAPSVAIASITWSASVATITTVAPHGWTSADVVPIVVAGATPSGYDGYFQGTITGTTTLTYPLATNPVAETIAGTVTLGAVNQLLQMLTTYFAGNGVPAINILELGEADPTPGVATLGTFITAVAGSPQQQYAYLVPRQWDDNSAFLALCANYEAVNSQLYFYVTTTVANRAVYAGLKNVLAEVEAPGVGLYPSTEFSLASAFGTALKQNPSSTNKVPPLSYAPSYGTTAYPIRGNQSIFQELANANVGWIGTGQQGGVSGNILFQGQMSDGNPWNFWYSIDWAQANANQALANEVINGSATQLNPLYYNQQGINRLQNRVVQVFNQGVGYGLGNGQVVATQLPIAQFLVNYNNGVYADQIVVNAEPFSAYVAENPSDYGIGRYAGLSGVWIPLIGFKNVIFNLNATTLLTG